MNTKDFATLVLLVVVVLLVVHLWFGLMRQQTYNRLLDSLMACALDSPQGIKQEEHSLCLNGCFDAKCQIISVLSKVFAPETRLDLRVVSSFYRLP